MSTKNAILIKKGCSIALFLIIIGCNTAYNKQGHKLPVNAKVVTVDLVDSLGQVTLAIPIEYDTNFSWTDFSDCGKPCDKIKYRFQPIYLPINEESGFIYKGQQRDSVNQLTITHSAYFPFEPADSSLIISMRAYLRDKYVRIYSSHVILDSLMKINNRYCSIIAMDSFDTTTKVFFKRIVATTTIKSNTIDFSYDLLTRKEDSVEVDFIPNSLELLKTIKIEKGY